MSKHLINTLIILGISYISGFLFSGFLAASDSMQLVDAFAYQRFISLMVENFIQLFPIMHVSAVLIAFSLFFMPGKVSGDSYIAVIKLFIILLIVFMLVYLVLAEVILPGAIQSRQIAENESTIAFMYEDAGDAAYNANNNSAAMDYYHKYLDIDPGNQKIILRFNELREQYLRISSVGAVDSQDDFLELKDSESYLSRAYSFYKSEDYLSAYYYAELAFRGNRNLEEAKRIMDESYAYIYDQKELNSERNDRTFFSDKAQAFTAFQNKDFETAYFSLKRLEREGSVDRDVALYMENSRSMLEKTSFFISETANLSFHIPVYNVTFINRKTEDFSEMVYAERVIYSSKGIYLFEIEVLHVDSLNRVLHHQRNPYGKIIEDTLSLHCLNDDFDTITYDATLFKGDSSVQLIPLQLAAKDFPFFSLNSEGYASRPFPDLMKSLSLLPEFGYPLDELHIEFLNRLLRPFAFIVISFAAMALGYALRSRYINNPPVSSFILMLGVPFMLGALYNIGLEIIQQLIEKSMQNIGFTLTLIIFSIVLIVALIVSLLILARNMIRKKTPS